MDTKGPLGPSSDGSRFIYVIVNHFSNYIVTVPTPKKECSLCCKCNIHHWISKFGPPQILFTDRRTENFISETANCCTLFIFHHSPRTSHAPWTKRLVEVQNKTLEPT